MGLLNTINIDASRQVIDISGDGTNNQGRPVTQARDDAIARGVVINGLPIMLKRSSVYWETTALDIYYRDCVIGAPGSFYLPVRAHVDLVEAIRAKIIREVAQAQSYAPLLKQAQHQSRADCISGELERQTVNN